VKLALKWIGSIVIAAFFVWLSLSQWPMESILCAHVELGGRLTCHLAGGGHWTLDPFYLALAFVVLVAVHFLRVLRWEPLVTPLAKFDFWTLNRVGAVSFMALFILPLRLGELARPYLIAQTGKLRKSAALGTIAVERVVDGVMMALLLALVLFAMPSGDQATYLSLRAGALLALLVFGGSLGILVLAYVRRRLAVRLVEAVFGLFSKKLAARLADMMDAFIEGMKAMPSWRHLMQFSLLTVLYWTVNGFYYYFMAVAFGLHHQVDLAGAYAMMAAVAVGMMIPNSPANVGSFWYFLLLPVALYGVSPDGGPALAFALAVWGLMLLQYAVFALYFVVTGKVPLESLWSLQKAGLADDQ
jgi:uncharacterized protein (TIRG00374 family)